MYIGPVALLTIVCIFCTLGFGIAEYKRTTWAFALVTSLLWVVVPILAIPEAEEMVVSYSRVFQPEIARIVVKTMYNLLIIAGIGGIVTCVVTGFMRVVRGERERSLKLSREKFRRQFPLGRGCP